jgi:hypothetical protein
MDRKENELLNTEAWMVGTLAPPENGAGQLNAGYGQVSALLVIGIFISL